MTTGAKANFSDCFCGSITVPSTWRNTSSNNKKSVESQTPEEMYRFVDRDTQSGRGTQIYTANVKARQSDQPLLDYLEHDLKVRRSRGDLQKLVEDGCVSTETDTIDYHVTTDPNYKVKDNMYVECADIKRDVEVSSMLIC
jgi:hypothetical protein